MTIWIGNLAGVSFEPHRTNLKKVAATNGEYQIRLVHNNRNLFDPNAILVYFQSGSDPAFYPVGHIPRPFNVKVLMKGLERLDAEFIGFTRYEDAIVGACIKIDKRQSAKKTIEKRNLTNTPRKIMV